MYDLLQEGVVVASVSSNNKENALKEIWHYALVYLQDGPVTIRKGTQV
jgi:hypothetical protein